MRIAIVNDVMTASEALRRVVVSGSSDQVAWIATDGAEAVEKCKRDTPDLVLMDLIMPVMDGAEATRRIMAQTPCAILIVTASMEENFAKIFEALGAGAVDVTQTPTMRESGPSLGAATLRLKIETIRRLLLDRGSAKPIGAMDVAEDAGTSDRLVAIGASAGGPAALATILSDLPRNFSAAIVIVQHVDPEFIPLMATWLNERSAISVRVARQGDRPQAHTALIAGTGDHLIFTNTRSLGYTPEPRNCAHHPSIDVFFESVARRWDGAAAGVLLTGMGRDGAKGLKALRDGGALTIAQDAATCVVYGMPKAAGALNAAVKILPLTKIAAELTAFAAHSKAMAQD